MLIELTVRNLAVIEETRLAFAPGLNVVTGETGAGKSLLVDALEFVLGGAADRTLLRAGAASASVEAVFDVAGEPDVREALGALDLGLDLEDDGIVALSREAHREGRTVSRLNGRAAPVSVVRAVGDALVDIHGQGAHLSLLAPAQQRRILDDYGGLGERRRAVADAIAGAERARRALEDIAAEARDAEQRRELLAFQAGELAAAALRNGEEADLERERAVLASAESLRAACAAAYDALIEGGANAADLLGAAVQTLLRAPDPAGTLRPHAAALESAAAQLDDAARGVRAIADAAESDPERLADVEERIALIRRLKRKYGGDEAAVAAFGEDARRRLELIDNAAGRRNEAEQALADALAEAGRLAWELSEERRRAADGLGAAVERELAAVSLGGAVFRVDVERAPADGGADGALPAPDGARYVHGADGIDRVAFMLSANPGEELRPLAKVASGGETSRMLLALNSALHAASGAPTLVFDEIDAGIGGRAATTVAGKLWTVARRGQALCVTHLPQIAAYADRHFRVGKSVHDERTYAGAEVVEGEQRVAELAGMMGGAGSAKLAAAARELLQAAEQAKGPPAP